MNSKVLILFALMALAIAQNVEKDESAADKSETADTKKDKRGLHGLVYANDFWDSGTHLDPDTVHFHSQATNIKEVPYLVKKRGAVPYAAAVPAAIPLNGPYSDLIPWPVVERVARSPAQPLVRRAAPALGYLVPKAGRRPVISGKQKVQGMNKRTGVAAG